MRCLQALWGYIKRHKLQCEADPTHVQCNARLKALLGEDTIRLASLAQRLSSHLLPAPSTALDFTVKCVPLLLDQKCLQLVCKNTRGSVVPHGKQ